MRKYVHMFFGLLISLYFTAVVSAQIMTPHYITATTYSLDSTGTVATLTLTLSGYATVAPGVPPNTTHTPHVYLTANGIQTSAAGTPVCPSCNVYATASKVMRYDSTLNQCILDGNLLPECYFETNTNGQVICTSAGTIYSALGNITIRSGMTNFLLDHYDVSNCYYEKFCPNGADKASCPDTSFTAYGGNNPTTRCTKHAFAQVYHLIVNGQCQSVGISFLSDYDKNCR